MEYETGVTLYNPEKNIKIGIIYLSNLINQYKVILNKISEHKK